MSSPIPDTLTSLRHFLAISDIKAEVLEALVDFSIQRKAELLRGELSPCSRGKVLAMIFQKSSLRTRLGFETAMVQLGGHAINLEDHQIGVVTREDVRDVARVISSMCDCIMARVFAHQLVVQLAEASSVPVINGLSDWAHPCQALADLMTIQEHFGRLAGVSVAYVGDGNNVARSLLMGCAKTGMSFAAASPAGYQLDSGTIEGARLWSKSTGSSIRLTDQPAEAVANADVVYTDVWTSMGHEPEAESRRRDFRNYQVNQELFALAAPQAVFMHCLPAHRGEEVTDAVIESPNSVVFVQAENRLHTQKALLLMMVE